MLLARSGSEVTLLARSLAEADALNAARENARHRPGLVFPDGLEASIDLERVATAELLLLAVPSATLRGNLVRIAPAIDPGTSVLSATKGIEPESCLRIAYLDALFPDATFVFLRRRAADNVSSLMDAWRARPRFVKYRLPEPLTGLGPLSGNQWSFTLVPGWRDLRSASLEEICARGNSAQRQRAVHHSTGSMQEVVRFNVRELEGRAPLWDELG